MSPRTPKRWRTPDLSGCTRVNVTGELRVGWVTDHHPRANHGRGGKDRGRLRSTIGTRGTSSTSALNPNDDRQRSDASPARRQLLPGPLHRQVRRARCCRLLSRWAPTASTISYGDTPNATRSRSDHRDQPRRASSERRHGLAQSRTSGEAMRRQRSPCGLPVVRVHHPRRWALPGVDVADRGLARPDGHGPTRARRRRPGTPPTACWSTTAKPYVVACRASALRRTDCLFRSRGALSAGFCHVGSPMMVRRPTPDGGWLTPPVLAPNRNGCATPKLGVA